MNSLQSTVSLRLSVSKSINNFSKQQLRNVSEYTSTAEAIKMSDKSDKIVIPKRIERKPTDILRAIASTVKRDYLAPHYKYHDDPFLIPTSNVAKRMYALSQESGRKAAQWVRQEHADLFQHKVADPPIEAYFPRAVYNENSEVDEGVLQKLIAQHMVSDSITVYGLLDQKGVELSRATKQNLLELVCYYNCQDPLEEDWIEERWFRQDVKSKEKKINMWKSGGVAEKLFGSISPPDAMAYSALVCGMAQAGDVTGAHQRYQEAIDLGLVLPLHVFNKLIAGAPTLKESYDLRWQFVEDMLGSMKQQGLSPDLGTLNAVLEVLSTMTSQKQCQKNALAVMAEFRKMGIKPSLASYYFLLNIFCRGTNVRSPILINILDILEGKSFTIQDPRDVFFFPEAMENCRFNLNDVDAAYRLDNLLHTGDNYNLIGDCFKESLYYRNFFALVCQMGTVSEFLEMYDKLVPHIYVPEPGIMELIIKTVDINERWEQLPRLWSDLVMFEQSQRESSVVAMLEALQHCKSEDQPLKNQLADVAWAIFTRIEAQQSDSGTQDRIRKRISWTGPMLGNVLEVLLRADRYSQALEIISCLEKRQQEILGVPAIESLTAFLDSSIQRNEIKKAIWCIEYCYDAGFEETVKMAQKLSSSVQLSDNEQNKLLSIVGKDALQKEAVTAS